VIFYNWEIMTSLANGSPKNIVLMVARLTYNLTCHSSDKRKDIFYNSDLTGDSYLLNPQLLLQNEIGASMRHMAEYVGLASYRRYVDYDMTGDSTLYVHYNHMKLDKIKQNPLLHVEGDKIHFKLEEQ